MICVGIDVAKEISMSALSPVQAVKSWQMYLPLPATQMVLKCCSRFVLAPNLNMDIGLLI